jgi:2'-5' RNA ligase
MVSRAIVTFPDTPGIERIELLRRLFDPLARVIPAHVTLVFPFESQLPAATLRAHVERMSVGTRPFDLELNDVTAVEDEYVFLDVGPGRQQLIELHDRLYTGPLARHLSDKHVFRPHITLGRLREPEALATALAKARELVPASTAVVREITVVRLDGAAVAEREYTVELSSEPYASQA